jgi:hypothetical protein
MVQTGVQRAFGPRLRSILGRTLRNRFLALLAGMGITALLQQHRYGTDDGWLCGRRSGGSGSGACRDAGRKHRRHADRAASVTQRCGRLACVHRRRHPYVPQGPEHASARTGACVHWSRSDAVCLIKPEYQLFRGRSATVRKVCDQDAALCRDSRSCRALSSTFPAPTHTKLDTTEHARRDRQPIAVVGHIIFCLKRNHPEQKCEPIARLASKLSLHIQSLGGVSYRTPFGSASCRDKRVTADSKVNAGLPPQFRFQRIDS